MGHQLSMSFELICLLDWLLKNKKDSLRKLIQEAVAADFIVSLEGEKNVNLAERLHETVTDFIFAFEDILLAELSQGLQDSRASEVGGYDLVDEETLTLRLQQVRNNANNKRDQAVERELVRRLLRRWKPTSSDPVN